MAGAVGHEGDTGERADPPHVSSQGKVGVHDDHPADPFTRQAVNAGLDRAIESTAGLPDDERALTPCPSGNLGIVTDDSNRKATSATEDVRSHSAGQRGPLVVGKDGGQPQLGPMEGFDGHEHGRVAPLPPDSHDAPQLMGSRLW